MCGFVKSASVISVRLNGAKPTDSSWVGFFSPDSDSDSNSDCFAKKPNSGSGPDQFGVWYATLRPPSSLWCHQKSLKA